MLITRIVGIAVDTQFCVDSGESFLVFRPESCTSPRFPHVIEGSARWIAYGVVAVSAVASLYVKRVRAAPQSTFSSPSLVLLTVLLPFVLGSLVNRWVGLGHEGSAFIERDFDRIWSQTTLASLLVILGCVFFQERKLLAKEAVAIVLLAGLTVSTVTNTRIGDLVVSYRGQNLTLYLVSLAVIAVPTWRILVADEGYLALRATRVRGSLEWAVLLIPHLLLSLRIDGLTTPGAWFHVGYFTGVVKTIQGGGLLLWDTPSQYGFLNMLLAAIVPGATGQSSFLRFQALTLFFVGVVVLAALRVSIAHRYWIAVGGTFLLLLHFADPALIGPQPFPSSSVVRFGPSVSLLALLSMLRDRGKRYQISTAIFCGVGLLWSFESFFYCSLILLGWLLGQLWSRKDSRKLDAETRLVFFGGITTSIAIVAGYSLFVLLRVGSLPDWSWFYLAASKFAEGFGGLPTDPWGAGLLLLIAIFTNITLFGEADKDRRPICAAAVGALLGWVTYYVGRSHSSNVIAIFPLIFIAVTVPSLQVAHANRTGNSWVLRTQNYIRRDQSSSVKAAASVAIVLVAVSVASAISNPGLPEAVAKFRVLPLEPIFEPEAKVDDSLVDMMRSVEAEKLPVAYVGNLGLLPPLPRDLELKFGLAGTWLPEPLGLLEEPISRAARLQMLSSYFQRDPKDGYLLWHKTNSLPDRGEHWLEDLSQTHECVIAGETEAWQLRICRIKLK